MSEAQPTLFDQVRPRFITTSTHDEFMALIERLQREGHSVPTWKVGKRNAEWVVEVRYVDE